MKKLIDLLNQLLNKGFESFGKYYSTYRGIVVDRNDPKKLQRLRVRIPEVYGGGISDWVYPQSVYSGKNYGAQCIPQVDTIVTITFEYGEPRRPRWAHGYFATVKGEPEISETELQDPDNYWFRTPKGLHVSLKENPDGDEGHIIKIEHPNGNSIVVDDNGVHFAKNQDGLINLGTFAEAEEFAIKGETWKDKQTDLLTHIQALTVSTAFGPSSVPINIADFIDDVGNLELPLSSAVKLD